MFVNLADHAVDEISENSVTTLVNLTQLNKARPSLENAGTEVPRGEVKQHGKQAGGACRHSALPLLQGVGQ